MLAQRGIRGGTNLGHEGWLGLAGDPSRPPGPGRGGHRAGLAVPLAPSLDRAEPDAEETRRLGLGQAGVDGSHQPLAEVGRVLLHRHSLTEDQLLRKPLYAPRAPCVSADSVACWGMVRRPSADFRERLVTAIDAGLPPGEAATHFRVSIRTIYRWLARHRRGEALTERPRSGRPPKLPSARYPELREIVLAQPDATLPEHAARLATMTGIHLSPSHLSRLLAKLELPLKKRA